MTSDDWLRDLAGMQTPWLQQEEADRQWREELERSHEEAMAAIEEAQAEKDAIEEVERQRLAAEREEDIRRLERERQADRQVAADATREARKTRRHATLIGSLSVVIAVAALIVAIIALD